jgi:endonuclease/exonuclease/phosphatase (EEP) superfamily protein YafD
MISSVIASIFVLFFVAMTFLPLVRSDFWTFRILEYPRLQKLVLGIVLLLVLYLVRHFYEDFFPWLAGIIMICNIYLAIKIFPYTGIAPMEMKFLKERKRQQELKIFTANVFQDNRDYESLLRQIRQKDPDIVFLVETDQQWADDVEVLKEIYPHTLACPLNNTYGLLFFSRFPVKNEKVVFRVEDEIPSIEAEIELPSHVWVKVYGLHPKPPVPQESLYSTAKDKELMKVAFEVEKIEGPCIVMGDLNDVAWSHVTELFRKVSGLLDPRRGRGFYSTFSAKHKLMRFPLDYIFCSSDFGLIEMHRMPYNGSDHFAMFIHLQYQPPLAEVQEEPEADEEERQEAAEKANVVS